MLTTTDVKFVPQTESDNKFLYTVAKDFEDTLVSIHVTDSLRGEETLPIR